MTLEVWIVYDTEPERNNEPYVLFSYDSQGEPHLGVFDIRHREAAYQCLKRWRQTSHPGAMISKGRLSF